MKAVEGIGPGVKAIVRIMESVSGGGVAIDYGQGVGLRRFYHPYGSFTDENSLSVVTFVQYGGVRIVFPGDLTKAAWELFMRDPNFVAWLHSTRIFVASHHGRDDGYYPKMFSNGWQPDVVIISDKRRVHETQLVDYGRHAMGINWGDGTVKRCLTTRRNGSMRITPTPQGGYFINTDC
jgi:hypothetical protein